MLRIALPTLRSAARPRRRALPGPVRRVRSSSLATAPAPVRRMKAQDCSSSFSASPPSPPCPGNVASNVSTATRFSGADSAGLPGCRQPGSPSPHSSAEADCRSSAACAAEYLAFSCLALRLVRNPPAAGLATISAASSTTPELTLRTSHSLVGGHNAAAHWVRTSGNRMPPVTLL
jgi:hypothetical protein